MLSKSPSVVSVALQLSLPEGEHITRLTTKVHSTTTLWMLLRQFESNLDGAKPTRNFTARASPQTDGGNFGAGRLVYETPVVQVMGRDLSTFTDLQKTLAQLGFNSGSVLLRLSFRTTERPLEEAMEEIDNYFRTVTGEETGGAYDGDVGTAESAPETTISGVDGNAVLPPSPEPVLPPLAQDVGKETLSNPYASRDISSVPSLTSSNENTVPGPLHRPIQIFAPPSTSTPAAARRAYNEKDYEPTIDHAKQHQSRLASSSRNTPLRSDAELAAQAEAEAKRKAEVKNVKIKVRFPDQSTVVSEFNNTDTSVQLYEHVSGLMENENEPFSLNFSTAKGPRSVPRDTTARLMSELGMVGSVLVNVIWEVGASSKARTSPALKETFREMAAEIQYKEPEGEATEEKENANSKAQGTEQKLGGTKKGGVPKWLKLPGKR